MMVDTLRVYWNIMAVFVCAKKLHLLSTQEAPFNLGNLSKNFHRVTLLSQVCRRMNGSKSS
jgi:hypothetical protein